jgi:hypothetical protein
MKCVLCGAAAAVQWQRRSATNPDDVDAVFACLEHAISADLAARIHAPDCTAPDPAKLPACGCRVEPVPVLSQPAAVQTMTTSTGWTVPAETQGA